MFPLFSAVLFLEGVHFALPILWPVVLAPRTRGTSIGPRSRGPGARLRRTYNSSPAYQWGCYIVAGRGPFPGIGSTVEGACPAVQICMVRATAALFTAAMGHWTQMVPCPFPVPGRGRRGRSSASLAKRQDPGVFLLLLAGEVVVDMEGECYCHPLLPHRVFSFFFLFLLVPASPPLNICGCKRGGGRAGGRVCPVWWLGMGAGPVRGPPASSAALWSTRAPICSVNQSYQALAPSSTIPGRYRPGRGLDTLCIRGRRGTPSQLLRAAFY